MRINLVQIGNSQGIRLPKAIIEQAQLTPELEIEVSKGALIIRSAHRPRQAWEEAAIACHASKEDLLGDWEVATADVEGLRG